MSSAVEITFRRTAPTEELAYFVRRACERLDEAAGGRADWHVLIDREEGRGRTRVSVTRRHATHPQAGCQEAVEMDPDPFLAARNAFGRLAAREEDLERRPVESGVFLTRADLSSGNQIG